MRLSFLSAIPTPWKLGALAVAALLVAAAIFAFVDRAFDETEKKGAVAEQVKQLEQTIQNVETANEARYEIEQPDDAGGRVRFCQCLRTARTPANCQRLLRGREAYLCGTRPE